MSDPVFDAVPALLRKIQEDMASFRQAVEKRFDAVEKRFEHLEDLAKRQRRDTAGLLVMAKAVSGDFAEEIATLQARVDKLEAHKA